MPFEFDFLSTGFTISNWIFAKIKLIIELIYMWKPLKLGEFGVLNSNANSIMPLKIVSIFFI